MHLLVIGPARYQTGSLSDWLVTGLARYRTGLVTGLARYRTGLDTRLGSLPDRLVTGPPHYRVDFGVPEGLSAIERSGHAYQCQHTCRFAFLHTCLCTCLSPCLFYISGRPTLSCPSAVISYLVGECARVRACVLACMCACVRAYWPLLGSRLPWMPGGILASSKSMPADVLPAVARAGSSMGLN